MKNIAILGSTGSIGTQTLQVIDANPERFNVEVLTANNQVELLARQARKFKPNMVVIGNESKYSELTELLKDEDIKVYAGSEAIAQVVQTSTIDVVVTAMVGYSGLLPTINAIKAGKTIALANKETLVVAGDLINRLVEEYKVGILPVDSEHSAIFQALQGKPSNRALKKIILTASGGPFFGKTAQELEKVTVNDALKHPNWSMGAKITIDSATMMNKGLELIEAVWLFGVSPHDVKIVVHRESIVHSAVEYDDNSVIAQLGLPDMRIPIQYALTYPERYESPVGELDLASLGKLTFFEPDYDTFRCINICREAIDRGGLYPAAVNGANEQANLLFRNGKIGFLDIAKKVEAILPYVPKKDVYTLDDVLEIDRFAREFVMKSV